MLGNTVSSSQFIWSCFCFLFFYSLFFFPRLIYYNKIRMNSTLHMRVSLHRATRLPLEAQMFILKKWIWHESCYFAFCWLGTCDKCIFSKKQNDLFSRAQNVPISALDGTFWANWHKRKSKFSCHVHFNLTSPFVTGLATVLFPWIWTLQSLDALCLRYFCKLVNICLHLPHWKRSGSLSSPSESCAVGRSKKKLYKNVGHFMT